MLLPSCFSPDGSEQHQYMTSFLVNDTIALDAGTLGLYASPPLQGCIRHVLLSHTHIDHLASLPLFLENVFDGQSDCVTIHASSTVLDVLRRDLFNDRIWPDFIRLSSNGTRFLELRPFEAGETLELDGVRITAVALDHVVPTVGFLVADDHATVAIVTDTAPTDEIWRRANTAPHLKAVFLEAAFPNELAQLADVSKHLTPQQFGGEARKLRQRVPFLAIHLKPRYREQIHQQLLSLGLPHLELAQPGKVYRF